MRGTAVEECPGSTATQTHPHESTQQKARRTGARETPPLKPWDDAPDPEVIQTELSDLGSTLYSSPLRTLHCTVQVFRPEFDCNLKCKAQCLHVRGTVPGTKEEFAE